MVEEDKSYFRFDDRYEIVKKATEHIDKIRVVPSGKFIISSKTMPAYFLKESKQEEVIDTSEDIEIFCEYIAPSLNITARFVGEEPLDNVTKQYNMEMKRTLTDYGMNFIEIPRKEIGGEVISASRVRKLLAQGKMEDIKKLVPAATYKYLLGLKTVSASTIMN